MWTTNKPTYGSAIRVNRGLYSHYGIYVSDEHVIHFSAGATEDILSASESARIIDTNIDVFSKGDTVETLIYDESNKPVRNPQEIVNFAYSMLGTGGYNLVTYNCEHFVNLCLYDKAYSNQVNNVFQKLFNL